MKTTTVPAAPDFSPLLDALARALDLYRLDHRSGDDLREPALALAQTLSLLRKADTTHPVLPRVQELARGLWGAGYLGRPVPAADLALASSLAAGGWPGLLGAMLFTPCWQWREAPALDAVPDWLWAHYVQWVFVAPCAATAPGAADAHLEKLVPLAEAVRTWADRNLGAPCVLAAVATFERHRLETSPLRSTLPLDRWAAARAGIFAKFHRFQKERHLEPVALPRAGRVLRVGVFLPEWSESLSVRALLPALTALDPAAFTLHLFAERARRDPLENACRDLAAELKVLPAGTVERVRTLRAADLDVLIFGGPLASLGEQQLLLHRLAPIQAVTAEFSGTHAFPEIDLHLDAAGWDADTTPAEFELPTRAELGLPATGPVLVAAPSLEHLSPETLLAWAALLHADSSRTLLLLLPAGSDTFALEQIFNRLQTSADLAPERLVLSLGDPRTALAHGDVYLDTYPHSAPTPLLAALAAGLPAVAWEGTTPRARTGAAVLRALDQADWVATDAAGYIARAEKLLGDDALRAAACGHLLAAIERQRGLGDAPLASLRCGDRLARAYDLRAEGKVLPGAIPTSESGELAEAALSRSDAPAAVAHATDLLRAEPDSSPARSLLGRAHLLAGNTRVALACLFSALRGREGEASAWRELGAGLRAHRDPGGALGAYETALKLDPASIESWMAISELARARGVDALADEALEEARRLGALEPQLAACIA